MRSEKNTSQVEQEKNSVVSEMEATVPRTFMVVN